MDHPENARVGCCGGDLLDERMEKQAAYGNFPSLMGIFFERGLRRFFRRRLDEALSIGVKNLSSERRAVAYVSGPDMFVRADLFERLGGFVINFFFYSGESEFAFVMTKAGYI